MDGSLSLGMVVISMVGIVSVVGVFAEAIVECSELGFEFLKENLKCFQRERYAKSLDVVRFYSGLFGFFKNNH